MPSSPKIPKELILKTALDLLIRDGYATLTIKTLAKELGCSTQPISWHFGTMDGLRKELAEYALAYANEKMGSATTGMMAFSKVGIAYIEIAFDEPNLFRYLYMTGESGHFASSFQVFINADENSEMIEQIAEQLKISSEHVGTFFRNTMIYTHGLASFVASGLIKTSKEEISRMVNETVYSFLLQAGANIEDENDYDN